MNFNIPGSSASEQVDKNKLQRDIDYVNERIQKARKLFKEAESSTNGKEKEEKYFSASCRYYDAINFLKDDVFYSREKLRNHFYDEYFVWLEEWSEIFNVDKKIDIYKDILIDLCKGVVEMCKTEEGQKLQNSEELLTKFEGILKGLGYKDESLKTPEEKLWDKINFYANSGDLRVDGSNYPYEEKEFRQENGCLLACNDYKEALEIFQKNPNLKEDTDKYFVILKKWSKILQTGKNDLKVLNEYRLYATKIYEEAIEFCKKNKEEYGEYLSLFEKTISALSPKEHPKYGTLEKEVAAALYGGNYRVK